MESYRKYRPKTEDVSDKKVSGIKRRTALTRHLSGEGETKSEEGQILTGFGLETNKENVGRLRELKLKLFLSGHDLPPNTNLALRVLVVESRITSLSKWLSGE